MKCPRIKPMFRGTKNTATFVLDSASAVREWRENYQQGPEPATGRITIDKRTDGHWEVVGIEVSENDRRSGLGTCLYEAAARFVCGKGRQLFSDTQRNDKSDGFWQKQVRRGRAKCIKCLRSDRRPQRHICVSGCKRYLMNSCSTTLNGKRK